MNFFFFGDNLIVTTKRESWTMDISMEKAKKWQLIC